MRTEVPGGECKKCGTWVKHMYYFNNEIYGSTCIQVMLGFDPKGYKTRNVNKIQKIKEEESISNEERIKKWKDNDRARSLEIMGTMHKSTHVGEIGDKIEVDITIKDTFYFASMYGESKCLKFVDDSCNEYVAFTTAKWSKGVKKDDKLSIEGVVKKHNKKHYNDMYENQEPNRWVLKEMGLDERVFQTQLTRVKLIKGETK